MADRSISMTLQCKLCASQSLKRAYDPRRLRLARVLGLRISILIEFLDSYSQRSWNPSTSKHSPAPWKRSRTASRAPERIAACVDLVRLHVPQGPLLDVGAGGGAGLARISELLPGSSGVELTPVLYEICRRAGLQISHDPLESTQWDSRRGEFGAISMWDVTEHVNDPLALCQRARRLLRDGGVLLTGHPDARWVAVSGVRGHRNALRWTQRNVIGNPVLSETVFPQADLPQD